jgi:hypothetical protein
MKPENKIVSLTREMLRIGIFNHLNDNDVSVLYHLLIQVQNPPTLIQQNIFISYWKRGNFFDNQFASQILLQCNEILKSMGFDIIEAYAEIDSVELY